ncbi:MULTISPECIES: DUF1127 domain-containing protein [Pseudomonadaceae]|uniref:DUF1127 domain-containing protein n=1 Tax=Pseudomonas denitrificans TaxID=43306 RepID=A0A9X7R6J6_PSEDE|nr:MULTISPECIES: DUF1127 domain-containing protein [Pseudomonadaceae]MBD9634230.1 DUF1127 domain-containing protein [Pseudomonas sp. PDM19]QEY74616.1 DUF1127 domain-containing protein [Pseudomonas denitrificans (nom. rej.)]
MESRPTTSPPYTAPGLDHFARALARHLRQWHQNARTRRQLAELTSLQLADLGISPSERVREISKPFWR